MRYTVEELKSCAVTRDMFMQWFVDYLKRDDLDKIYNEGLDLKVIINGDELSDPFKYFSDCEAHIDGIISQQCKTLIDFDKYIYEKAEKKANEIVAEKVEKLQYILQEFLSDECDE